MITDGDVKKLKDTFATKQEFADLRVEVGEVKDAVYEIRATLDKVAGVIQDLWTENATGAVHLGRHDGQIAALAAHTGAKIPD